MLKNGMSRSLGSERLLAMKKPSKHLIAEVPRSVAKVKMTIGIDLGDVWSHYCTLNEDGEVVDRGRFRTTPSGVEVTLKVERNGGGSDEIDIHLVGCDVASCMGANCGLATPPRRDGGSAASEIPSCWWLPKRSA